VVLWCMLLPIVVEKPLAIDSGDCGRDCGCGRNSGYKIQQRPL
jgi:hypothetical protein